MPSSSIPDDSSPAILVALATYNERQNLPSLVAAVHELLPQARILVVDDNSPDGTGGWCDEFAAENDWFTCIHRPGKLGLGSASWAAMESAVSQQFDFLITLDADWSHPPDALPRLLAAAEEEGADVVIGSRYCPGGGVDGWPRSRRMVSRVVNAVATRLARLPARDCSTAYRLYRVNCLSRLDFTKLRASGYAYLEEVLWALARDGAKVVEVPIIFTERRAGKSKANLREAWGKFQVLSRLALAAALRRTK
ncbi:polyprenol monophosphomannose synthase [Pirellulales bacterium]|nr:polyprenol monophosphomannose synthase [Pirellulales bacterium]